MAAFVALLALTCTMQTPAMAQAPDEEAVRIEGATRPVASPSPSVEIWREKSSEVASPPVRDLGATSIPASGSGPSEPWHRWEVWVGTVGMAGVIVGLLGLATNLQGSTGTGNTSPGATPASSGAGAGLAALPIGPYAGPMMMWGLGLGLPLYLVGSVVSAAKEDEARKRATGLPGDDI
ncbi:MAG: hypothetical protein VKO21_11095 [Candidatus Sericytochromatia bacterium]|nr:hypothetical protein [Candidatus Sericytochromatia bacterium]